MESTSYFDEPVFSAGKGKNPFLNFRDLTPKEESSELFELKGNEHLHDEHEELLIEIESHDLTSKGSKPRKLSSHLGSSPNGGVASVLEHDF